ncbi:phosphoribosylglycinamide synthetase [Streptomyces viridochromogenes]|uniref:Phosphoribosylglycinamide synthetase n=1 Tax=Streptomyces viridochromogenes TaxID=1938 RepID=A0A0J7Z5D2_STRVR|nr:ATP-grasp domain-containing protein [Streptomyces viridochromogenes]KMS71381.1 phosphoribosylglycinamide synthetase [Streptomyces viridochromogenes]KOG16665.1 phosphoribosylglycinamide synthetase [Streptomyces viridochromogenes]KOG17370.1 phosphoribosylglycinamide synthetase [Streptomyces viridochromogenes]
MESLTQDAVLLLDPVKTGANYKPAVRDRGLAIVSVYTVEPTELRERWPSHADGDDATVYASEAADVLARLAEQPYRIRGVVPAMESAVHLAEQVAEQLGLPGNGTRLARARRNKAEMRRVTQAAGVRVPEFHLVHSLDEVPAAAEKTGFPAILKPTTGAGSHGVTLLPDAEAARHLEDQERRDLFGWEVTEWLVERYVRGREIAVNCFSFGGQHRVVDMWEYRRPDDADYDLPYWGSVQLDPDDADWQPVAEFVATVLDSLDIRSGPSHTEVKCAADGIYLIETGARLPGGPITDQWTQNSDIRPFHDALDFYLDDGSEPRLLKDAPTFHAVCGASAICNEERPGTLVAIHGLDVIEALPGVDKLLVTYQPGDQVPVTRNTKTIPLGVWVSGATRNDVIRTLDEIRDIAVIELAGQES